MESGEYTVQATLNALVDPASYGGSSNSSIATATPIDPYANTFIGKDNRTAVLGRLTGDGDSLVSTERCIQELYIDKGHGSDHTDVPLCHISSF